MGYKSVRYIGVILATLFCVSSSLAEQAPNELEKQAAVAATEYMNAWLNKDIETIWKLSSPKLRGGNGNFQEFKEFIQGLEIYLTKFEVLRTQVEGSEALIEVKVSFKDFSGNELGEIENMVFVPVDGSWYFDSYTTQGY